MNDDSSVEGAWTSTTKYAQHLRKRMTPAEALLWKALRNKKLRGLKFLRQAPIGNFIVDFLCRDFRIVIEIDGEVHNQQQDYDAAREQALRENGFKIIRFSNEAVMTNLREVLIKIASSCGTRLS